MRSAAHNARHLAPLWAVALALIAALAAPAAGAGGAMDVRGVWEGLPLRAGQPPGLIVIRITSEYPTSGAVSGTEEEEGVPARPLAGTVGATGGILHAGGEEIAVQVSGSRPSLRMAGTITALGGAPHSFSAGLTAEPVTLGAEPLGPAGTIAAGDTAYPVNVDCPAGPACSIVATLRAPPGTPDGFPIVLGSLSVQTRPALLTTLEVPVGAAGQDVLAGLTAEAAGRATSVSMEVRGMQGTRQFSTVFAVAVDATTHQHITAPGPGTAPMDPRRWVIASVLLTALLAVAAVAHRAWAGAGAASG